MFDPSSTDQEKTVETGEPEHETQGTKPAEPNATTSATIAERLGPCASRLRSRRSLGERLDRAHWTSQISVSVPGFGRVATARRERGGVVAVLYERCRAQLHEIAPAFAILYPGVPLLPPVDPDWLRAQRASWLRRYGRRRM